MKIAIPTYNKLLCAHFGHCAEFAIIEADADMKAVLSCEYLTPPPHEPGVLPKWISGMNVDLVIAGGMGQRAQELFNQAGVKVLVGAMTQDPQALVKEYLDGTLECGTNVCDH